MDRQSQSVSIELTSDPVEVSGEAIIQLKKKLRKIVNFSLIFHPFPPLRHPTMPPSRPIRLLHPSFTSVAYVDFSISSYLQFLHVWHAIIKLDSSETALIRCGSLSYLAACAHVKKLNEYSIIRGMPYAKEQSICFQRIVQCLQQVML